MSSNVPRGCPSPVPLTRYDIFLVGNLEAYRGYNTESDPSVRFTSKLVVDPLGHCQSGAEYFKQDLIAGRTLLSFMQVGGAGGGRLSVGPFMLQVVSLFSIGL